jgi:geranylgeranyl diphosphate synthase type I
MSTKRKGNVDQEALGMLKEYQKEVNFLLKEYFEQEIKIAQKTDLIAVDAIKSIQQFVLAGGKRLRPALLYYSYLAAGGHKTKNIKQASLAIELIHVFLLIHDDIMDNDDKRHGIDTIHKKYEKIARRTFNGKDNEHFGRSVAIVIGDLCYTMANKVLFNASFRPEIILKALDRLQDTVYDVIPGQIRDVRLGYAGKATEKEILKVQEAKTAHYTFNAPIELGYILAENKNKKEQAHFKEYSMAMGKAFQIRDDILGIFGDEKTLGKPVGSDIIEGKQTLLVNYALKHGSTQQKEAISAMLGLTTISQKQLKEFRQIITDTGALKHSQKKGNKMVNEAICALDKISFANEDAETFFKGIAEYIVNREI